MKNNALDDIVKCDVEISAPASSDEVFDRILIVVPGPTAKGSSKSTAKTFLISKADDLIEYGYKANEVAYAAAEVAFSQSPTPSELAVCVRVKTSEGSGPLEDIKTTLSRARDEMPFYGVHITSFRDANDVKAAIEWVESNEKILGIEFTDIGTNPVKNFNYFRTFEVFSGKADGFEEVSQPEVNQYSALALMAKCFGYEPGTETWALKELTAVAPSVLGATEKKDLENKNIIKFLRYAGKNITIGGKTLAGEWIDVIRFRDWIKAEMQIRTFNAIQNNLKVPFTDKGIGLIESAMISTLQRGQTIGGIAENQFDKDGHEIPGFVVSVPKSSDLTEAERKSRKLTGCSYTARLAGAIHAVEIKGRLTF